MQIEITLKSDDLTDYSARDLGFLLHKNPDRLHHKDIAWGSASLFFRKAVDELATAVLTLEVDPIALVRGRHGKAEGLLSQYVNDRPYVANSFLSVAISRVLGQSMAGKSKERQALAERALPFEARVVPVSIAGGEAMARELFEPLGYEVECLAVETEEAQSGWWGQDNSGRCLCDLRLSGCVRLKDLLSQVYVLIPVLDNQKHFWVSEDEVEKLLDKGRGWLEEHPAKALIAKRALKHRRSLARLALSRLVEEGETEEDAAKAVASPEAQLEKPIRLHDLRLDRVAEILKERGVQSVLDLGCGEGKLLQRLVRERGFDRLVGVDASVRSLERARDRLHLDTAGEALRARLSLQMGSLTYADRRWRGFDAATLVEVIEHIDPPRLSALELSLFGEAQPGLVVVTTPNREYNALFETMLPGTLRHPDHRFEWSREEFGAWGERIAAAYGYAVEFSPLGPEDETHGAPSQMAVFTRRVPPDEERPRQEKQGVSA